MGTFNPLPVSTFMTYLKPEEQVKEYNKLATTLNKRIQRLRANGVDVMLEYPSLKKATEGKTSNITATTTKGGYFKKVGKGGSVTKDMLLGYSSMRDIAFKKMMFTLKERKKRKEAIDRLSKKWLKDNEGREWFSYEEYEEVTDAALYAKEISSLYYEELMYAYENGAIDDFTRESQNALWSKYGINPDGAWTRDTIKEALGAVNKEIVNLNKEAYKESGEKYQKTEFRSYYDERDSGGDLVETGKLTGITQLERHAHSRYRNTVHVKNNAEPKVYKMKR